MDKVDSEIKLAYLLTKRMELLMELKKKWTLSLPLQML